MKRIKLKAMLLCVVICLSAVVIPNISAEENAPLLYDELENAATTPDESLFKYILLPKNDPQYAVLQKYTGGGTSVIVPDELGGYPVKRVLGAAFADCEDLQYLELGDNVTSFTPSSQDGCSSLRYIQVSETNPSYVTVDGVLYSKDMETLVACPKGYKGTFTVPDSVVTINGNAFSYCFYLTDVIMPNSVEYVNDYAFSGCNELDSVRLSDNLTFIGDYAFFKCQDLHSIRIPYSVIRIGKNAFLGDFSSDNHLVYYVLDGIYFTPGTYAEEYVKTLHLPLENLHHIDRRFTDPASGISLIDPYEALPKNTKLDLRVNALPREECASLIGIRYDKLFYYDISLYNDNSEITLTENIIVDFTGLDESNIPSATKIFRYIDGEAREIVRAPQTPFAGVYTTELGAFIIASNSDFSLKGDIDGNGVITTYDARFALCISADLVENLTPEQSATADFDGNGTTDTSDALKILRKAAGII